MQDPHKKRARREAFDRGDWDAVDYRPTAEQAAEIERYNADLQRMIKAGSEAPSISTWAEVAASVDDATWDRILGDLTVSRTEVEAIRPHSGQARLAVGEETSA